MSKNKNNNRRDDRSIHNGMVLREITPKTRMQELTFDYYNKGHNLLLHGCPGTGKSFLSVYLGLQEVLSDDTKYRVTIIRSAQPSKDMGHLPGTAAEKMRAYEKPYIAICNELFQRGDAYGILKTKGLVEFESTSFLRGTNLDDSVIIIDEGQNLTYMELKTVLTRVGRNSRVIVAGDLYQDDLTSKRYNQQSGFGQVMGVLSNIPSISTVEFGVEDIVRSGFVKDFIKAEMQSHRSQIRLAS